MQCALSLQVKVHARDFEWETMYQELMEWRNKYGTTIVPKQVSCASHEGYTASLCESGTSSGFLLVCWADEGKSHHQWGWGKAPLHWHSRFSHNAWAQESPSKLLLWFCGALNQNCACLYTQDIG